MTDHDREAADALAYRIRVRDAAIRDGQDHEDPEMFAQEFVMAMRHRGGWRPTVARAPWDYRSLPAGDGLPASEEARRELDEARRMSAEASARLRARAAGGGAA